MDWIMNHMGEHKHCSKFLDELSKRGDAFEKLVINDLSMKLGHPVVSVSTRITPETVLETKRLMHQGEPIIHSAPLSDPSTRTRGIADLLIRSDCLHNFFDISIDQIDSYHRNNLTPYYYIVVDIKFRTFKLKVDKKTPRNTPSLRAFKDQLLTYTKLVGSIQGYQVPFAFLLGRQYEYIDKKVSVYERRYDTRLVRINFTEKDHEQSQKALQWTDLVRTTKPVITADMINLNNRTEYDHIKRSIARQIGDATLVWQCGVRHRELLKLHGIDSIYDARCTADILGFNGSRARAVQAILDVNRGEQLIYYPDNQNLFPKFPNEYFIDFEIIPESLLDPLDNSVCSRRSHLFLVGIGQFVNGNWNYVAHSSAGIDIHHEKDLINRVIAFLPDDATLYHWGHIEKTLWTRLLNVYNIQFTNYNWVDMYSVFIHTPVAIKGCFDYGLKSIALQMASHGMIQSIWTTSMNGTECATHALDSYTNNKCIDETILYNETDCRVLCEIISYFRNFTS